MLNDRGSSGQHLHAGGAGIHTCNEHCLGHLRAADFVL